MRRALAGLLFGLLVSSSAFAGGVSPPGITPGGDGSGLNVTALGGNTARTSASRSADVVNVRDFGAVGDDTHDDTAAINAAFAALRTHTSPAGSAGLAAELVFPQGTYKITGSINATAIRAYAVSVKGAGAVIDCQATGKPCIDALDSRWMRWRDLSVVGSATATPTIGMQIGHILGDSADDNEFQYLFFSGAYSFTAFYNFASETSEFSHVYFWNNYVGTGAFSLVQDGYNHFGVTSAFITQAFPADTTSSFNENVFVNCDFREQGGGVALWIGRTSRHRFIASYVGDANSPGQPGAILYTLSGDAIGDQMLDLDVHFETTNLGEEFLVSGTNATPLFNGLKYRDQGPEATGPIFKLDTGVTGATIYNANIEIGGYQSGQSLLDNGANWTIAGYYGGPLAGFNAASWSGPVCSLSKCALGSYGTGGVLAQQPDSTTTGGNPRGSNAVDLQTSRTNAGSVASGNYSIVMGGQANAAPGLYGISGGFASSASGQAAVALGQGNTATGLGSSIPGGINASDRGRSSLCFANGVFAANADAQTCKFVLRGTTSTTTAVQLAGNAGVGSTTVINIPTNAAYTVSVQLVAIDHTNPANSYSWTLPNGLLSRATGAPAFTAGTPVTASAGTTTGIAVSAAADTTNNGLNLTFTPPTGNSDKWNAVATVRTTEVQ